MSLFASESINIKYPQAFCTAIDIDQASGVQIINTEIMHNAAVDAVAGLLVILNLCRRYAIEIRNVTFSGNILDSSGDTSNPIEWWPQQYAGIGGGNLGVYIGPATPYHSLSIKDCIFSSGVAQYGGAIGIFAFFSSTVHVQYKES